MTNITALSPQLSFGNTASTNPQPQTAQVSTPIAPVKSNDILHFLISENARANNADAQVTALREANDGLKNDLLGAERRELSLRSRIPAILSETATNIGRKARQATRLTALAAGLTAASLSLARDAEVVKVTPKYTYQINTSPKMPTKGQGIFAGLVFSLASLAGLKTGGMSANRAERKARKQAENQANRLAYRESFED